MHHLPLAAARGLALAAALLATGLAAVARTDVSVGVQIGLPIGAAVPVLPGGSVGVVVGPRHYWTYGGVWYRPWGPRYVVVEPPVGYYAPEPPPPEPRSVPSTRPDPVIYPRNGQNAQQTEYDRQACNRWAVTQPQAVADAAVFQRAIEACMDGRGYSVR